MATATLKAYSGNYPSITNRLRASVAYASSPLAIVADIIENSPHVTRTWSFDGLPRNNYRFYLDEIDGSGNVLQNLADFDVVPGEINGTLSRDDEQIQVDVTPGLVAGATSWTLDGTSGKKDYRGWTITVDGIGRDILVVGLDYSWDEVAGTFQLLQSGDVLASGQYYNIHFNPQNNIQGNSYPSINDFNIRLITSSDSLTTDDFGNKVIVEPSSNYIEINLPDINTVVEGRKCMIEMSVLSSTVCAKFIPVSGQLINFLKGNVYLYPTESFSIYCFNRSGIKEWRLCDTDGNFKTVGQLCSDDAIQADIYNKQLLDGSIGVIKTYSRLYNDYVLNLPIGQVVSYSDWSIGNNKYYYSLDDGSGNFHFPDRRGVYDRNSSGSYKPGDYLNNQNLQHSHHMNGNVNGSTGGFGGIVVSTYTGYEAINDVNGVYRTVEYEGGAEARPETVIINKYVMI